MGIMAELREGRLQLCGEISEVRLKRARLYSSPRLRSDVADKLGKASGFGLGTWLPSGFPYCH